MNKLIGKDDTIKNYVPIGSLELKLAVARAEGYAIRVDETRYHHVVDGTVVTSVDESKPKYYYYNDRPLPMLNPYRIAMEFYLKEKTRPQHKTQLRISKAMKTEKNSQKQKSCNSSRNCALRSSRLRGWAKARPRMNGLTFW